MAGKRFVAKEKTSQELGMFISSHQMEKDSVAIQKLKSFWMTILELNVIKVLLIQVAQATCQILSQSQ